MGGIKKLAISIGLILMVLLVNTKKAEAQDLDITSVTDMNYPLCTLPDTSLLRISLYNSGPFSVVMEPITFYFDFGDGTDSLRLDTIASLPVGAVLSFYMTHVYTLPGIHPVQVVFSTPSAGSDTANIVNIVSAGCGLVVGTSYLDNNSNCIFDTGDDTLGHVPIYLLDSMGVFSMTTTTDNKGNYSLFMSAGTNYTISAPTSGTHLGYTCPSTGEYSFTGTSSYVINDFGYHCLPGVDPKVTSASTIPIPGSIVNTYFDARNHTCTPVSGTITLQHDTLLTYLSNTGLTPSSISPGLITWNYSGLDVVSGFESGGITFLTSTLALIGDTLDFKFSINPIVGDMDTSNNIFSYFRIVSAPYDPNIKEVSPAGNGALGYVDPDTEFTYTVFFQNTGTAPAIDVEIKDTIDTDLELMTFELLGSSHYMTYTITSDRTLTATFDNINLPDSTSDEPGSHGWFMYKIKAKPGLSIGTSIENTAHIFFDYNPAIVTNTTLNTIYLPVTSSDEIGLENSRINVYPNPSANTITLITAELIGERLMIMDMSGKVVSTKIINADQTVFNVEQFSAGVYQVAVAGHPQKARFQVIH